MDYDEMPNVIWAKGGKKRSKWLVSMDPRAKRAMTMYVKRERNKIDYMGRFFGVDEREKIMYVYYFHNRPDDDVVKEASIIFPEYNIVLKKIGDIAII